MAVLLYGLFNDSKNKLLKVGVVLLFLLIQGIGIFWTYNTHWIFQRAILAKTLVEKKSYFHEVGSEEYFSLGANTAAEVYK